MYKVLNTDTWSYVQASNIDDFLIKHQWALREGLISSSIKLLDNYSVKGFPKEETVPLMLGLCGLEIEESTELIKAIEALKRCNKKFD